MGRYLTLKSKIILPLVLLGSTCCVLSADSISGGTITITNQAVSFSSSGAINQFNPSLGTLTGIEFLVTAGGMSGSIQETYTGGGTQSPQTVTASITGDLFIYEPTTFAQLSDTTLTATQLTGQTLNNDGTTNTYNLTSPGTDTSSVTDTNASDFGDFEGTGTVTLPYAGSGTGTLTVTSFPPGLAASNTISASVFLNADVQVVYEFNDVVSTTPEPTSFAFMGGGLLGIAYFLGRKLKKG